MILKKSEIQQVMAQAKVAFPNFKNWRYNNKIDQSYLGFSIWGKFVLNPKELMPTCFFITLDLYQEEWRGYLTVGQPSYLWSSADFGDAYLLSTERCNSCEEAIASLKSQIVLLFKVFISDLSENI